MSLHRASTKPDWELVPPTERSVFQRAAAATHGIIAPANIVTAVGFGMVLYGLWLITLEAYLSGVMFLAAGRVLDVVDGAVAEATKTKSPLGEMLDAVVDKTSTLIAVIVLLAVGTIPWWVVAVLSLPQFIITGVIAYKKRRHVSTHPTRQGKLSMATAWIGIVGLVVSAGVDDSLAVVVISYGCVMLSFVLGLYAACQYARWERNAK